MSKIVRLNDETCRMIDVFKSNFRKSAVIPEMNESQWVKIALANAVVAQNEVNRNEKYNKLANEAMELMKYYGEEIMYDNSEQIIIDALEKFICEIKASHGVMKRVITSTNDLVYSNRR